MKENLIIFNIFIIGYKILLAIIIMSKSSLFASSPVAHNFTSSYSHPLCLL